MSALPLALPSGFTDLAHAGLGPQTPRGTYRCHGHPAYLGPKPVVPSAPALRRHRRRLELGWRSLDLRPARLLLAGQSVGPAIPRQVPGGPQDALPVGPTPLGRECRRPGPA